jgi:hypothetical protein
MTRVVQWRLLYSEAFLGQRWSNFMDLKDWVHCSFFWRLSVEVVKNGIWEWSWMQFPYLWDVNPHCTIISIADMIINMWCSTSLLSTCKSPVTSPSREQLLQAKSLIETQTEGKNCYINMWCSTSLLTCKSPVTSLPREQMLQGRSWIEPQTEEKNWNIDHQYVMLCIPPCLQIPNYIST